MYTLLGTKQGTSENHFYKVFTLHNTSYVTSKHCCQFMFFASCCTRDEGLSQLWDRSSLHYQCAGKSSNSSDPRNVLLPRHSS